jgi:hypothetical protein
MRGLAHDGERLYEPDVIVQFLLPGLYVALKRRKPPRFPWAAFVV